MDELKNEGLLSLLTDRYELTMLEAALNSGVAHKKASFEVFSRALPPGRRYGVIAGVGRIVDSIKKFRFSEVELEFLKDNNIVGQDTIDFLTTYKFSGDIWAYREGEIYFPFSPVMRVDAPFGEAILLETLILSILNFDSAIASAGARMITAANGRMLVEMGSRRTHEWSAVSAARAAYIIGFASTSNLKAGQLYAIPTTGTIAHAFILAHSDEKSAFEAQLSSQGTNTTILVDTYNIEQGIKEAIYTAGTSLSAVRIDSGNPAEESLKARKLLDSLGATGTKIIISGDLDEYKIEALSSNPIDSFGVGTKLVTGSGEATANFVYKLVAIQNHPLDQRLTPVAKKSISKSTLGGRKSPLRIFDNNGFAQVEFLDWLDVDDGGIAQASLDQGDYKMLQEKVVSAGAPTDIVSLDSLRQSHKIAKDQIGPAAIDLSPGPPAIPTVFLGHDGKLVEAHNQSATN
jgi:nicotinate phosphoribosyltransferase